MSMLAIHLEQIALSCEGIDSLPFPPPKIFTNAMLYNTDITSLIRDTEAHERALFSVPPPPPPPSSAASQNPDSKPTTSRRQTVFNVASGEVTTGPPPGSSRAGGGGVGGPRRHTAVSAVLGGDLHAQLRRGERQAASKGGDVDVEVLLQGATKLCGVYALPGALERIPQLRSRYAHQTNTLAYYEAKVAENQAALERMNKDHWMGEGDEEPEDEDDEEEEAGEDVMTEEDLRAEEEFVRELDKKKRELQQRLRAMEKDLGALLNM
ncbi:DASH complex subunit Spc34 [Colletotrichum orchidophilum]|uniref:DASH complex subunit SPC34 n=1 Tax=Colletotrichum orchidophilum TaxID=1209926 RepID=A0A1G4BSP5_9PEZI|nr:DASH complex subunit Spc34 [Colletotrichum orchidophilum]OHF04421.1 DASH complex subunit Spc34 [Colletotrichum orchidophilum]